MLRRNGTCVVFGVSAASTATIESREFFATGGTRLYGLTLFHELMSVERAGIGLGLLAGLIEASPRLRSGTRCLGLKSPRPQKKRSFPRDCYLHQSRIDRRVVPDHRIVLS
jgi:hypothetical protein